MWSSSYYKWVPKWDQTFQRHKIVPGEQTYCEAANLRLYNSHAIDVFSIKIKYKTGEKVRILTINWKKTERASNIFLELLQAISCITLNHHVEKLRYMR